MIVTFTLLSNGRTSKHLSTQVALSHEDAKRCRRGHLVVSVMPILLHESPMTPQMSTSGRTREDGLCGERDGTDRQHTATLLRTSVSSEVRIDAYPAPRYSAVSCTCRRS